MGWETLIPLIISQGLPLAERLWQLWTTKAPPSQADWDSLKGIANKTSNSQMLDALVRAGIDPASPQGKALLGLTA